MSPQLKNQLYELSVRLGDDALILGQRLCEWCGHAPSTEIDLTLSNLGLDLIGQARHFLTYAGELEGKGRDEDGLAFERDALDFKNCLLVEQPNGDFAQTIARHFLFSTWQLLFLEQLAQTNDETLRAIARKSIKEISYHASISAQWVIRLGDGTPESHDRMMNGLDWMWRFVDELFLVQEGIEDVCENIGLDLSSIENEWRNKVAATLKEATLDLPADRKGIFGGRVGHHSEHLGPLLSEMQSLPRTYNDANW